MTKLVVFFWQLASCMVDSIANKTVYSAHVNVNLVGES